MSEFTDKVVVITGASSGIGKEFALQLADQGAKLVLAARSLTQLVLVAKACQERGAEAIAVKTDVSNPVQCEALIEHAIGEFERVDMLVNNAGRTMWAKFEDIEDIHVLPQMMDVNFWGSVWCTYYALPHLKETQGRIVGISSLTGKAGVPTRSIYAATKHAMAGFFDSIRIELEESGVTVTMIYPGFVQSDIRGKAMGADGNAIGESPVQESNVMTTEECVRQIIQASAKRKRELVMTLRGKLGLWVKLFAPSVVDKIARKAIESGK